MQDARDEVVAVYRRYCTVIDSEVNVPEDHLGFELTFWAIWPTKPPMCLRPSQSMERVLPIWLARRWHLSMGAS